MTFKTLRITALSLLLVSLCLVLAWKLKAADWDFKKHTIPLDEIESGGPPKDGIPALTTPKYVSAGQAEFMRDNEQVLGVEVNGVARAYPTRILSWHELVNDRFGGLPVLVSW
ncbi:MAG: DUF3179 domain-containing protein [Deltaproteobacteria bacterium]|jgi:hypothetical protein|nr:DUF3179 domain-containing protein [Deltaproteobacteria bacterium]